MSHTLKKIHILGAGLAGLGAASYARKKFPRTEIVVYEAAAHCGGRCFSYFDSHLQTEVDNATHVILGANRRVREFWNNPAFVSPVGFYNLHRSQVDYKTWNHLDHIGLSVFNTPWAEVPLCTKLRTMAALFPFLPAQTAVAYSKGDLTANLISPLRNFDGEIILSSPLRSVESQNDQISCLNFDKKVIEIQPDEMIISALDDRNYQRIFGGHKFDHHRIINVVFRTSMALTLPDQQPFLALEGGLAEWIFTSDEFLAATISNAGELKLTAPKLARLVWEEVCAVRGGKAAFLPDFRVFDYPFATIAQDQKNNVFRPDSAFTNYRNLRIAGDWTLKNHPCCLEGALLSSRRAINSL